MTLRRNPIVSVSLVTYNHERYVTAAIESILGQSLADLELIVVDDGSTDATPQRIAEFRDPRVVAIRQRNEGPGAATNRALAECRGRYVALMSGDDVAASDRLERQLASYERGPRGLLFSGCDFIDEDGAPVQGAHF